MFPSIPAFIHAFETANYKSINVLIRDHIELSKASQWLLDNPDFIAKNMEIMPEIMRLCQTIKYSNETEIKKFKTLEPLFKEASLKYPVKEELTVKKALEFKQEDLKSRFSSYACWQADCLQIYMDFIKVLKMKGEKGNIEKQIKDAIHYKPVDEAIEYLHNMCSEALEQTPDHPLNNKNQETYKREFNQLIIQGKEIIDQKKPFNELLSFFANQRYRLAQELYHYPLQHFGTKRPSSRSDRTPLSGKYSNYRKQMESLIPKGSEDYFLRVSIHGEFITGITVRGKINDKEVELTQYLRAEKHITESNFEFFFGDETRDYPSYIFLHTDPTVISTILNHVDVLVQQFSQLDSLDQLISKVAEIEWWMAHAMPWNRGSASISEMLMKSLLLSKGIEVTWEETLTLQNKQLDLEALITPNLKDFIALFPSLITYRILSK